MKNERLKSGYTCMEQCLNEQIYEGWWNIHGWTTDSILIFYQRDIDEHTVVELIIGQFLIKTVIFRGNYILLINRGWGHYRIAMSHQGRGLRFPCNDRTDRINKLFIIIMAFSLWIWACDQLKPITGQRITLKKHITSLSCTLGLAIQSCDTGQRILFWQLSINHNMDVHKDVHYQVKHRLYICLGHLAGNARSLQENNACLAANQRARTIVAI